MPIGPTNIFAVVTAIERYELGADWNNLRTVRDGIAFVRWLLDEERIPAENIAFFVEPRDDRDRAALDELELLHGLVPRAASVEAIKDALTGELAALIDRAPAGDCALYFFWSGHGVIDADERQCLVCREADGKWPRALRLEDARKSLRMEEWRRLTRQAFFIDACAGPYQASFRRELRVETLPSDDRSLARINPMQFVAAASPPGRAAVNDGADEDARFFAALLDALRRAPKEEGFPDMDYATAWLERRYGELEAQGRLANVPWFDFDLRGWNGRPAPRTIVKREGESDDEAMWRRTVRELLLRQPDPAKLHGCYRQCVERGKSADALPLEMMADLDGLPARNGVPRIWEWMVRIGLTLDVNDPVNQWLVKVFRDAKLGDARLAQLREAFKPPKPPFHLFVEIPETTACRLRCRVHDSAGKLCAKPEYAQAIEPSNDSIRRALGEILRDAVMGPYVKDLHIELFVPKPLLAIEADQEDDPHDADCKLGENYRFALRWIERANPAAQVLADRWEALARAIFDHCETCALIDWTAKGDRTRKFNHLDLVKSANLRFLRGFSFDPFVEAIDPLLEKALDQGVPFALWGRGCGGDWNVDKDRIERAAAARDRHQMPCDIRDLRRDESLSFGVLWDDPDRGLARWGGMFSDVT
jgi:hypothetical protein